MWVRESEVNKSELVGDSEENYDILPKYAWNWVKGGVGMEYWVKQIEMQSHLFQTNSYE